MKIKCDWILGILDGVFILFLILLISTLSYLWFTLIANNENLQAAWIQGLCTFSTGICALWAGNKPYQATTNETQLHKQKEESRRVAYRCMMREEIFCFGEQIKG